MKLTKNDREEIRKQHAEGKSISQLARDFKVTRQYIQFIVYPERQKRNYELRKAKQNG